MNLDTSVAYVTVVTMPSLHIRNISDTLMRKLKSNAALNGITLRDYVIMQLGGDVGQPGDKRVDHPRPDNGSAPPTLKPQKRTNPYEEAGQSRRKPGTCEHGTERGYNCWQCGGVAKV